MKLKEALRWTALWVVVSLVFSCSGNRFVVSTAEAEKDMVLAIEKYLSKCPEGKDCKVSLPPGKYLIDKTVELKSNLKIVGDGETVLIADFVPTKNGGHPVTVFETPDVGVNNVVLSGITFDAQSGDRKRNISLAEETRNTLRFCNSKNIVVTDCVIKGHYSNIPAPYKSAPIEKIRGSVGVSIEFCENISLLNVDLREMQNEAIWFWRSKNIVINEMNSSGNGRLSTHLSFWYCNGVDVGNSRFSYAKGGGSAINCESSNVKIGNNSFQGGRGIDLSNEGKFEPYTSRNVEVSNNVLNDVSFYGIMRNRTETTLENLKIKNNDILIDGSTGKLKNVKVFGIKTDDSRNALVTQNNIRFHNHKESNKYIAFGSFGFDEENTRIHDNDVIDASYLYWGSTYVGNKDGVQIIGNRCELINSPGQKAAILVENGGRAKPDKHFYDFKVSRNRVVGGNKGTFVKMSSDVPGVVFDFSIEDNQFNEVVPRVVIEGEYLQVSGTIKVEKRSAKLAEILDMNKAGKQSVIRLIQGKQKKTIMNSIPR